MIFKFGSKLNPKSFKGCLKTLKIVFFSSPFNILVLLEQLSRTEPQNKNVKR